jgi:hypothetical protein
VERSPQIETIRELELEEQDRRGYLAQPQREDEFQYMGGRRGVAGSLERRCGGRLINRYENAIDAEKRKEQEFLALAERFRAATDPQEIRQLGDQMGRMVFGD